MQQGATEGELWTREQLEALLGARFSPVAVLRFLAASQRRASQVRRARPDLGRQSLGLSAAGALAWGALAAAGLEPFRSHVRSGLAWWALTAVMLDWHLGMVETPEGRPRRLGVADALTLSRVWLAPAVLHDPTPRKCTAGFATDVLDGMAARGLAEPTRAGRDLEGLADGCFAAALVVGLRRREALGRAAARAELARLGAGLLYALGVYFGRARAPDPSLMRAARLTTPMRASGLAAAAAGRRRTGTLLVLGGCVWSIALDVRAASGRGPAAGS